MQDEVCLDDQKELPKKEANFVVLLIVSIGDMKIGNALIDLGTNMDIIPLSVVEIIEYLPVELYTTKLQMEDKTYRTHGSSKICVETNKFSFHVDFVILYVNENQKIPLILGRPFMKTTKMLMDIDKGEVNVKIK